MPAPAGAPAGVFISEVANNVYSNSVSWLEIYNNSGAAIDLSRYSLRAPAIKREQARKDDQRCVGQRQRPCGGSVHRLRTV